MAIASVSIKGSGNEKAPFGQLGVCFAVCSECRLLFLNFDLVSRKMAVPKDGENDAAKIIYLQN